MAFWWGITSLIRHAPNTVSVECIPPCAAAAASSSPSRVLGASFPAVKQTSPQDTQTPKPTPQRTRPPFVDAALSPGLDSIGEGAARKSRDRFLYLKCSEDGGKMGSSSSSLRRFDSRDGEGLWRLTGSEVVWNRLESERDGGKGRWEGR